MSEEKSNNTNTRLIPLVDWPKHHKWPPIGGLRHMAFHSNKNGFDKVIKVCLEEFSLMKRLSFAG